MRKRGPVLMLLGVLLLAGAIGLTGYNRMEEARADAFAEEVCQVLKQEVIEPLAGPSPAALSADLPAQMQSVEVERCAYIGVLDIPALGLSLPVQETWSLRLLRNAPCRYTGSFLDDSMIVAAHNYKRHFGGLARLEIGSAVTFTDVDGNVFSYEVASLETLDGSDVEGMTAGDWDLTLFTCTLGGKSRVTVRCLRNDGGENG